MPEQQFVIIKHLAAADLQFDMQALEAMEREREEMAQQTTRAAQQQAARIGATMVLDSVAVMRVSS